MSKPIRVNVIISCKNGKPAVLMQRLTTDTEIVKLICSAAYRDETVVILPQFTDKLKGLSSMIQKGIIALNKETQEYEFLI